MIKRVKCEIGHFYDSNKYTECPHCKSIAEVTKGKETDRVKEPTHYWDSTMSVLDIVSFKITSGDYPIRCIKFEGNKLIYYNAINGSRDGADTFPEDFFNEITIPLTIRQMMAISSMILVTEVDKWVTCEEIDRLKWCFGFCTTEKFMCKFADGREFNYIASEVAHTPESFRKLFSFLYDMCGKPWYLWHGKGISGCENDTTVKMQRKKYKEICPACKRKNNPKVSYCGFCGVDLESLKGTLETSDEECDLEQTMWMCPSCMATMPAENLYCDNCGARHPWK